MRFWPRRSIRVGIYVDAFNAYYGARGFCRRGTAGWRWLDLMSLSDALTQERFGRRATITSLVYCTAMREKEGDPSSSHDQNAYVNALQVDNRGHVELGQYNVKNGKGVLTSPKSGRRRKYTRVPSPGANLIPDWLHAEEIRGPEGDVNLLIHYTSFEEKGSDVNVATHLIADVLTKKVDAAIVFSNDGDLRLPLQLARHHVPVGLVNPSPRPLSHMLMGDRDEGVGGHWWHRLTADDYVAHQLPAEIGGLTRPHGW